MNSIDLNSLEKKTFGSIFMDGLLDIQIGLIWIVVALNLIFDQYKIFLPVLFMIPILYWYLKKKVVAPRIGIVRFSKQRRKRMISIKVVISAIVLLGIICTFLIQLKIIPGIDTGLPIAPVIIGTQLLLVFLFLGYFLQVNRLYFYGILISAAFVVSEIIIHQTEKLQAGALPFLIASGIMVFMGFVLFLQFLKKYPLPKEEDHV